MSKSKTDRRTLRTRRLLREALLSLILEKGYGNITIEEITDRADVGRATFYLHYKDKEDLLLKCINSVVEELIGEISNIPLSAWQLTGEGAEENLSPQNPILQIFLHVTDNADLYRIIMRGAGTSQTQNRVRDFIANAVTQFLIERSDNQAISLNPTVPMEVFSNYFAGSLMGLITWWLEADRPYPAEEMTRMFQILFFPGARDVLGLSFN
jgi:AcrR family transcriptional regulator